MISGLPLVRFRVSLWLWAKLLPFMAYGRALTPLVELARAPGARPYQGFAAGYVLRRVKRACRRPWLMRDRQCLREGLLAWRFLSLAGHAPVLRFGVEKRGVAHGRLSAHCWVEVGGEIVLNAPLPGMVEVLALEGGAAVGPLQDRGAR
jgi:hypothetical protein